MALTSVEAAALSAQARQLLGATQPAEMRLQPSSVPAASTAAPSFSSLVADGLSQVNGQLVAGQQDLQRLALGEAGSLHQVMTRMEESRISFQLMLQVRGRLLEAYQDLMKMPL